MIYSWYGLIQKKSYAAEETLNSVNEAIEFTMEFSDKEIPFLDILIKQDNREISMYSYHKATDI